MDIESKNSNSLSKDTKHTGINRRGLVKGLASTPLIMTVASRPVWANRCSVSGNLSGNLSNPSEIVECVLAVFSIATLKQASGGGDLHNAIWSVLPYSLEQNLSALPSTSLSGNSGTILEALDGTDADLQIEVAAYLNYALWQALTILYEANSTTGSDYALLTSTAFYFPVDESAIIGSEAVVGWPSYQKI